jgi:hypothetical protein
MDLLDVCVDLCYSFEWYLCFGSFEVVDLSHSEYVANEQHNDFYIPFSVYLPG